MYDFFELFLKRGTSSNLAKSHISYLDFTTIASFRSPVPYCIKNAAVPDSALESENQHACARTHTHSHTRTHTHTPSLTLTPSPSPTALSSSGMEEVDVRGGEGDLPVQPFLEPGWRPLLFWTLQGKHSLSPEGRACQPEPSFPARKPGLMLLKVRRHLKHISMGCSSSLLFGNFRRGRDGNPGAKMCACVM